MPHLTFRTTSEDETIVLGIALGRVLRAGDVILLDGRLGAGKTRLVRGIAEGQNLDPAQVSSPTYVLVHEYTVPLGAGEGSKGGGTGRGGDSSNAVNGGVSRVDAPLYHVDAYRLSGPDELESIGWDRVMDGFGIVVIEWGERIMDALKTEPSVAHVRIQHEGEDERRVDMILPKSWVSRTEWRSLRALGDPRALGATRGAGGARGTAICPVTGKVVEPTRPTYPFADEHARMADLGRWLTGRYIVSRELTEDDLSNPDLSPPDR